MDQKFLYNNQFNQEKELIKAGVNIVNKRDKYLINEIQNFIKQEKLIRVIELSIGDGSLSLDSLNKIESIELTCVDISSSRINFLKRNVTSLNDVNIKFIECNFDTQFNEIQSSYYDVVIAFDIMEHVFDVFGFITNCYRILKNKGIIFLRVPN